MTIKSFSFNPFSTNCMVVFSEGDAAVVDPSCESEKEIETVLETIRKHNLTVRHLLLTHAHIDHIFGVSALAEAFDVPVRLHADDAPLLQHAEKQAEMFGIRIEPIRCPVEPLVESEQIQTGQLIWDVLHTPGHSPGSVSFVDRKNGYVIVGDVLFQGSIGRTDLWGGSLPLLMKSIFQKIVPLGPAFVVYPGHGPATTVGAETASNPFLTGSEPGGILERTWF